MMSVTGFVTIRSNLHVKFLDMKSRKNALLTLNFLLNLHVIYQPADRVAVNVLLGVLMVELNLAG